MNTTAAWSVGLLVVLAAAGGLYLAARPAAEEAMMEQKDAEAMMEEDKSDAMMEDKKDEAMTEGDTMMQKGTYEPYSAEKLALAQNGKVVLFFHATWCPTCRAIENEINAGALIPAGVHILKVDYDTATALKQKYGVTVQHTFVQVDASGVALQKFNDAATVATAVARLK